MTKPRNRRLTKATLLVASFFLTSLTLTTTLAFAQEGAAGDPAAANSTVEGPAAGDPAAWHSSQPDQPKTVIVRGATIWTAGDDGVLENADLLVVSGEIKAVGTDLSVPGDAIEIDGTGKHVTPGLIDAHSHSAIVGAVNEGSNITTAEVRIANLIDAESRPLYDQLAGGLTNAA